MIDDKHPAYSVDGIEFLSQPLTTEDGYINPACINELESAIRRMPETYERLADDPEWSTPWIVTLGCICSSFAKAVLYITGGVAPNDFLEVLGFLRACMKTQLSQLLEEMIYDEWSLCEINRRLHETLGELDAFDRWNEPGAGDYEWLDLSAVLHYTCVIIRDDRRCTHAFDLKFEREHGGRSDA